MKLIRKGEGEPIIDHKGHFGCWDMNKLLPGKDSKRLRVVLSHFLPQGGTEMRSTPDEKAYFVVNGSLMVEGKNDKHLLEPGDLLYIAASEDQAIRVPGTDPTTILVIVAKEN